MIHLHLEDSMKSEFVNVVSEFYSFVKMETKNSQVRIVHLFHFTHLILLKLHCFRLEAI